MKAYRITIDVIADDAPTFDPGDPWNTQLLVALCDVLRERAFLSISAVQSIQIVEETTGG